MIEKLTLIAEWLKSARFGVAFTGAGISTESGIPDFRSPGGIWATSQPVYFDDFLASAAARYEYWRQKAVAHADFVRCRPNVGHQLLARWQQQARLQGIITQNIDGLHQDAGSTDVVELHGTARQIACLSCESRFDADPLVRQFLAEDAVPDCPQCAGLLKHATISFGQMLSPSQLERAVQWSQQADLMITCGSSLVVSPANMLPQITKQSGGHVVIINREPTHLDALADARIQGTIGETLSAINELL